MLTENEIAKIAVDSAFEVHSQLGPGLLESVYETCLAYELEKRGIQIERQKPIPIVYEGLQFNEGFRAGMILNGKVLIELKSVENLLPVHSKQLLTYLRLSRTKLGLLINFNCPLIKDGIHRVANGVE